MKLKQRGFIFIIFLLCAFMYKFHNLSKSTVKSNFPDDEPDLDLQLKEEDVIKPMDLPDNLPAPLPKHKYDIDVSSELNRLRLDMQGAQVSDFQKTFQVAANWVNERQIYPNNHPEMASILKIMSTAPILHADVLPKGTQIKLLLELEGGQKVVFKQKRYNRDTIIKGKPYEGFDRHNAEIAAFHLDRLLDFRRSPLVVGRRINLKLEVMPVATERLLKTFRKKDGNICYYGQCLYCKEENMACADEEVMEGSLTLWLPKKWSEFEKQRHPYQRTYRNGVSAQWEIDGNYCAKVVKKRKPYDHGPRLLDITDGTIFDYLIGNADRHHYETFKGHGRDSMILMMDNAKSFGNPNHHESSILAPLRQCCLLRNSTWIKLQQMQDGVLTQLLEAAMENDPIAPVLHVSHLNAMDIRLLTVIDTVDECINEKGSTDQVIVDEWKGL